ARPLCAQADGARGAAPDAKARARRGTGRAAGFPRARLRRVRAHWWLWRVPRDDRKPRDAAARGDRRGVERPVSGAEGVRAVSLPRLPAIPRSAPDSLL